MSEVKGRSKTDLLDISEHRVRGQDVMPAQELRAHLSDLINHEMKATQATVIQPYPNILLLSRAQFDLLRPDETFEPTDELVWRALDLYAGHGYLMLDIHVKGEFEPMPRSLLLS